MSPPPLLSKRLIDPLNSVAWFVMDACWLGRLPVPAYLFAGLTVATGLLLLVLGWGRGRGERLADLGLLCWIGMNTVWLVHDLNGRETPRAFVGVVATLGAGLLVAAAWHSGDLRRLRLVGRSHPPTV